MTGCAKSEDSLVLADIVSAFGLAGKPIAAQPVTGAWSHRMYKLITTHGSYAVKQMLDTWADPKWRQWVEEASGFERAAYDAGVAMPLPIPARRGGVIADVESGSGQCQFPVRVHEWVESRPCPAAPVDHYVATRLGKDLATMHALGYTSQRTDVFPRHSTANLQQWARLVDRVRPQDEVLAEEIAALAGSLDLMRDLFDSAQTDFQTDPMSHGDVDQKNILLAEAGPVLCDWDVAAPWDPRAELARTAMSLARWERADIARATITAYRSSGGALEEPLRPQDLAVDLVTGVDWLVLCIERAASLRPTDARTRQQSRQMLPQLLAATDRHLSIALHIDRWLHS